MTRIQEERFAQDRTAAHDLANKITAALAQPPLAPADSDSPFILIRALQIVLAGTIVSATSSPSVPAVSAVVAQMLLMDTEQMASRRDKFVDTFNTLPI